MEQKAINKLSREIIALQQEINALCRAARRQFGKGYFKSAKKAADVAIIAALNLDFKRSIWYKNVSPSPHPFKIAPMV